MITGHRFALQKAWGDMESKHCKACVWRKGIACQHGLFADFVNRVDGVNVFEKVGP